MIVFSRVGSDIRRVVAFRPFWFYCLIMCLWSGFNMALMSWLPRYSLDVLNMPRELTGVLTAVIAAGTILGNLTFGWLHGRAPQHARGILIASYAVYMAVVLLLFTGSAAVGVGSVLVVVLVGIAGMMHGSFTLTIAALREMMPPDSVATGLGIFNALVFLAAFVYPWLVGVVMDAVDRPGSTAWTYSGNAYTWAFVVGLLTLFVSAVGALLLERRVGSRETCAEQNLAS